MMHDKRLIDANALIKKFEDDGLGDHSLIESVLAAGVYAGIDNAPTIDAVPVVHAKWEYRGDGWYCSACKKKAMVDAVGFAKYCCRCGAMMDGGAD